MDVKQKEEIFNIIFVKNKMKIFNRKDKEERLKDFLLKNNIKLHGFNMELNIKNLIIFLKNINVKCNIEGCNNERPFIRYRSGKECEYGFSFYCSKECVNKNRSLRQIGVNNSCHKMTEKSFNSMKTKNSVIMKEKIKNGTFTPNITNSWSRSKISLVIYNQEINYRSSWEAFFHLCNTHLEYEKLRIEYEHEGNKHNYIVDFVDHTNKIVYEIKPDRCRSIKLVIVKEQVLKNWAIQNNYKHLIIGNEWFKTNFVKNIHLLNNQKSKEEIIRKLKQFNKK
jgi:hypothetical protein